MNATHRMKAAAATAITAAAAAVTALADVSAHAATPAGAMTVTVADNGPKTRAQVMAEFYEARRLGLLDNGGDAGPSEQVLARREAYNQAQAAQWMAQQRAAQTAAVQAPAGNVVIVTNGTGQRIVVPPGSVLLVTPADPGTPSTAAQGMSPSSGTAAPEIQADEVIVVDVPEAAPAASKRPKAQRERPPARGVPAAPAPDNRRDPADTPKERPLPQPQDQLADRPQAPTGSEIPAIIIMEGDDPQQAAMPAR